MENRPSQELVDQKIPYSKVGIVSCLIQVFIPVTIFLGQNGLIVGILMSVIGIVVGIGGIIESFIRKKKKLFAMLGIIVNICVLCGLFWILGQILLSID